MKKVLMKGLDDVPPNTAIIGPGYFSKFFMRLENVLLRKIWIIIRMLARLCFFPTHFHPRTCTSIFRKANFFFMSFASKKTRAWVAVGQTSKSAKYCQSCVCYYACRFAKQHWLARTWSATKKVISSCPKKLPLVRRHHENQGAYSLSDLANKNKLMYGKKVPVCKDISPYFLTHISKSNWVEMNLKLEFS